jgi:Domain of unknown function (DUF6438)
MTPAEPSSDSQERRWSNLRRIAVSVNVGASIVLGLLIWASVWSQSLQQKDNFGYYFLRSACRVGDLFLIPSRESVSIDAVRRELGSPRLRMSLELTCLLSVILIAALVCAIAALLLRGRLGRWFGAISVFAGPLCYVAATTATKSWDWGNPFPQTPQPLLYPPGWILICELAIFIALGAARAARNTRLPLAWQGVLFVIHFGFWGYLFSHAYPILRITLAMQYMILALIVVTAGAALYSDFRLNKTKAPEIARARLSPGYAVAIIAAGFALYAIWAPLPHGALGRAMNQNRVRAVQLSRGPCYGSCARYSVTVNFDGTVEYIGHRRDDTEDVQHGQVTEAQFTEMVALLRDAGFESLEDRAFMWAFDTPTVSIEVVSEHASKKVVSDAVFVGAPGGPQARFVATAAEIDKIVDTAHWREATAQSGRR